MWYGWIVPSPVGLEVGDWTGISTADVRLAAVSG